ncbi:heme-dependent oxidative N-demethylase family protein [Rhizobium sp. PAMB 3174]
MATTIHAPIYTPDAGLPTPFSIGLKPIDYTRWIEPDADIGFYLDEKARVCREGLDEVFRMESGTEEAQEEVLARLTDHLASEHADLYRREGSTFEMGGHRVDIADTSRPALLRAGSLVQDDLVLMRRKETGWHIVAAYVAFPSSWSLSEKFGQPMEGVHSGVPGFQNGTRNAQLVNRIFDNLLSEKPVERMNWSIKGDGALPQPVSKHTAGDPAVAGAEAMKNFVRAERQTLSRLPVSGDILFTIRVFVDPLAAIAARPDAAQQLSSMARLLEGLNDDQLAYKGLRTLRDPLVAFLRGLAVEKAGAVEQA